MLNPFRFSGAAYLLLALATLPASAYAQFTPVTGASLTSGPIAFPAGFMPSVKTYGAVGDGKTDDTAAIQTALSDSRTNASADYYGQPKGLYFPPGTYLVHDTLKWIGCCVTLQGDGSGASIIRLAPASSGFTDPTTPKPVILTPAGNQSFHQNIWDLQISVGAGNPGATALSYISNNSGSIHNVYIHSEDGHGHAGIDLTRNWSGPLMVRDTKVVGFDVGFDFKNSEYSSTLEGITLSGQNIAGIRNSNQPVNIHRLVSTNKVPAISNTGGFIIMIDGQLTGGTLLNYAIQTNTSMYLRNINSTGYLATLKNTSGISLPLISGLIAEQVIGAAQTISGNILDGSLNLPVSTTPSYSSSTSDSASFIPRWYGDTAGLQALLNSGKSTIYFPFGRYFSAAEAAVIVPDTVKRIVGYSSVVNGSSSGLNGGGIRLIVQSNNPIPLVIEQFGYGMKIDHVGARPVAIKDARVDYLSAPGAGNLFLEDVEINKPLVVQQSQSVWARQIDNEGVGPKISNLGGSLWVLGLKTESAGTVMQTTDGGRTELLGALIYPSRSVPSTDVAFVSVDSQTSYMYTESVYCAGCGYATQMQETKSGITKSISASSSKPFRMPLFIGY